MARPRRFAGEPSEPSVRLVRGDATNPVGRRPDEARPAAPRRSPRVPRSAVLWRKVGDAVGFLGWQLAALRAYELAVRRHPGSAAAHYSLGEALARSAQWRRAASAFAEAVRLRPSDAEYHGNLVLALWKTGQYEAAVRALDRLVFLKPRAGELHLLQGRLLSRLGHKALALRALRQASELAPSPGRRRFLLGEALLGAPEWDAAVAAWRAAAGPLATPPDGIRRRAARRIRRVKDALLPRTDLQTLKGALLLRLGHRRQALRALTLAAAPGADRAGRSPVLDGVLRASGLQASRTAVSVLGRREAARRKAWPRVVRRAVPATPPEPSRRGPLLPLALMAAALALGTLAVQAARARAEGSAAQDDARARALAEACLGGNGRSAVAACRAALGLALSPERATLVRRSLARALEAAGHSGTATASRPLAPSQAAGSGNP